MKIFFISPVRTGVSDQEKAAIAADVAAQEAQGHEVYWPIRDTLQEGDPIGTRICADNRRALAAADLVRVWYKAGSEGSVFDFGMAFALDKPIDLANPNAVQATPHKSFPNVLLMVSGHRYKLPR